jgi:hypothetical protein
MELTFMGSKLGQCFGTVEPGGPASAKKNPGYSRNPTNPRIHGLSHILYGS